MAKKSKRSSRRTRRVKSSRRHPSRRRHYGGVASVNQRDDMSWSSKVSMGQGADFLKYHTGQHGGAALVGAPLGGEPALLPSHLHEAAGQSGTYRALAEIAGMRDQAGGRRRRRSKRTKKAKKSKKSKKHHSRKHASKKRVTRRRRGGASINFSPYPAAGHLLSAMDQSKAGLSGGWENGIEAQMARQRASM